MKAAICIWIIYFFLNSTGCPQTNKIENGYAYARNILSGLKPKVSLSEDGTITTKGKHPGIQYFIYLEAKNTLDLDVKTIRINNEEYLASAERVPDLPVVINDGSDDPGNKDTLVAAGNYNVWKINVGELLSSSDTAFAKPKQNNSKGVTIGFLYKGSLLYYSIPEIKSLEPVRLQ